MDIPEKPLYNEETRRSFRRQVARQIYLPLAGALLVLVGLAVGFSLGEMGTASLWADISLMMLIIPAVILGIITFVLAGALVYGVSWLIGAIPSPAFQAQQIVSMIADKARSAADGISEPIIRMSALQAVFRPGSKRSSEVVQGEEQE